MSEHHPAWRGRSLIDSRRDVGDDYWFTWIVQAIGAYLPKK
jgi:hypothetical protein